MSLKKDFYEDNKLPTCGAFEKEVLYDCACNELHDYCSVCNKATYHILHISSHDFYLKQVLA